MGQGCRAWRLLREALSTALAADSRLGPFLENCLVPQAAVQMPMP